MRRPRARPPRSVPSQTAAAPLTILPSALSGNHGGISTRGTRKFGKRESATVTICRSPPPRVPTAPTARAVAGTGYGAFNGDEQHVGRRAVEAAPISALKGEHGVGDLLAVGVQQAPLVDHHEKLVGNRHGEPVSGAGHACERDLGEGSEGAGRHCEGSQFRGPAIAFGAQVDGGGVGARPGGRPTTPVPWLWRPRRRD